MLYRRMRTPVPALAATALVLGLALPAAAPALDLNGFLPARGEGTVALSYTAESYDEFWRGDTKVPTPPFLGEVETTSYSLWLRYGFTDRFSVVANVPYVDVDTDGTMGLADDGVGDVEAVALFRAVETSSGATRHRLVAGVGVRTPAQNYAADAPVSLGDGSTDLLLRLVYQLEIGSFYLSQQVGYDSRSDDVPDTFPLFTEAGYTFGRVTGSVFYSRLLSNDGTDIGESGFTFPSNEEEYSRAGGKLYARFTDAVGASVAGFTTLDGKNTGVTTGFSAGLVLSY